MIGRRELPVEATPKSLSPEERVQKERMLAGRRETGAWQANEYQPRQAPASVSATHAPIQSR